jgi:hypothetical protein
MLATRQKCQSIRNFNRLNAEGAEGNGEGTEEAA